jgi:starch-binding outer membrane protein, SusD/RagB family
MKKFIILISIIFIFSCSEEKLSLIDPNRITFDSLLKSEKGVESLVLGIYERSRTIWMNPRDFRFIRCDTYNVQSKTFENYDINKFTLNPLDSEPNSIWENRYGVIARVNLILNTLDETPVSNDLKDRFRGELCFFRAKKYFELVRLFGAVPLFTTPLTIEEARKTSRSAVDNIYTQIISDLNLAIDYLPESVSNEEYGRLTKYAAMAYLAKVYMTLKEWQPAGELLKLIINSNKYTFYEGNWVDIFAREDLQPQFYIFAVRFRADELGNNASPWWDSRIPSDIKISTYGLAGEVHSLPLSEDVINSFDVSDVRRNVSISLTYENAQGVIRDDFPSMVKFHQGGPLINGKAGTDFPFIRYSDVVLLYAEVCNELNQNINDAYFWLNKVRNRAGLESISPSAGNALRLAIEEERKKELFGEGHRWFDLVRTGRAVQVMNQHFVNIGENLVIDENDLLFPIPNVQILRHTSEIQQNPGY